MPEKSHSMEDVPVHETLRIGVCLALVGGFLDVYTYLFRGGVFANAQTGNLVLLGVDLARGDFVKALYYLIPVAAFFFGVLATEFLKARFTGIRLVEWQHVIVMLEAALLFIIGFLPASVPNPVVNVTVSFICSVQVQSFRQTKGMPYATTMCTGNLRSAAENFFYFLAEKDQAAGRICLRYGVVILAFCVGAAASALLTGLWAEKAVWVCCGLLLMVLGMMLWGK